MIDSKLVRLFSDFSKVERNQLEKFLHSPIHNQHKGVLALFDYLNGLEELTAESVSKTSVFQAVFPGEEFSDLRLRHVNSYFFKAMEEFLAWTEFSKNEVDKKILLSRVYNKRKLHSFFEKGLLSSKKKLDQTPIRDLDHYYQDFQIHLARFNAVDKRNEEVRPTLQSMSDSLDLYFVINKLKAACSVMTHSRLFNVDYDQGLLEDVLAFIEKKELDRIPAVGIYYSSYLIISNRDTEIHFFKLKKQLLEFEHLFKKEEVKSLYLVAINHCIRMINTGNAAYLREVFELYQNALQNKVLLDNHQLSPWTYKNIHAAAIKLEELDWAAEFVEEYRDYVPVIHREAFYKYNLARLEWARKNYRQVPRILLNLQTNDVFTNIDARVMVIKANFELEDHQMVEYLIDSLKQFLRRKEVLAYHKKNYSNFARFVLSLIRLKEGEGNLEALRSKVEEAEILTERAWLLEKLDQNEFTSIR